MKHDLIVDMEQAFGDYHNGWAECRRCEDAEGYLCCNNSFLTEECPSGQMEMFPLDECGPVVLN